MSRIPRHPPNFEPSDGRYTFSVSLPSHLDQRLPHSLHPSLHATPPTTSTGLRVRWSSRIKLFLDSEAYSRPRDSDRFSN
jgi:hypothetical protein